MNRKTIAISAVALAAAITLAGCTPQGDLSKNSGRTSATSSPSESGAPAKSNGKAGRDLEKQSNKGGAGKQAENVYEQKPAEEQEQPAEQQPQAPEEQSQAPSDKGDVASGFLAGLNDAYVGKDAFETANDIGNRGDVQQIRFLQMGESDFMQDLKPEGYKVTSIFGGPELLVIEISK